MEFSLSYVAASTAAALGMQFTIATVGAAAANMSQFDDDFYVKMVLRLKPGWVKGHARAAAAYMGLLLYSEAKEEYEKAVKLEPDDKVMMRMTMLLCQIHIMSIPLRLLIAMCWDEPSRSYLFSTLTFQHF